MKRWPLILLLLVFPGFALAQAVAQRNNSCGNMRRIIVCRPI